MISVDTRYDGFGLSLYPDSVNNYSEISNNEGASTRVITDWLYDNGFGQKASKIWKCGSGAVELIDDHHHRFAHVCGCRSDICLSCSEKESDRHKQRYGRVLKKMRWISMVDDVQLGYCVLTIPKHLRSELLDTAMLKEFHRKGWECLSGVFGGLVDGATTTLHFFGEPGINSGVWNPHINILFPVRGSGFVDRSLLAELKERWGLVLSEWLGVDCLSQSNVWYSYMVAEAHQVHSIKYVTRSTIGSRFMDSPEYVRYFIAGLRYYNNVRWWGKLSYRNWRDYLEGIAELNNLAFEDIVQEQKTSCECPICGDKLRANKEIRGPKKIDEVSGVKVDFSRAVPNEYGDRKDGGWNLWKVAPVVEVASCVRFSVVIVGDGKWFDSGNHWFDVGTTGLKADLPTYIEYLFVKEGFTVDNVKDHLRAQHGVNHSDVVEIRMGNDELIQKAVIKMTVFSHIRSIWSQLHYERPDQFPRGDIFDLDEMLEDGADVEDFRGLYRRSREFLDVALEIKEIHRKRGWEVG